MTIPRRYKVERTKFKKWFNITDLKEQRSFWMHITDFGITNKHLPKYCAKEARELFESSQSK